MRALKAARSAWGALGRNAQTGIFTRCSAARAPLSARGLSDAVDADDDLTSDFTPAARPAREWPLDELGRVKRTAKARRLGISTSPHKLNLVARLVRGMTIGEAQRQMVGCRKWHSTHVAATIEAARVNARAHGLNEERLVVSEAFVGKGRYLKKIRPWHGKGRFGMEEKKYAHLTIILRELDEEMWEQQVMPQYVHMQRRGDGEQRGRRTEFDLEGWTTVSDLDASFRETRARVEGLKAALGSDPS